MKKGPGPFSQAPFRGIRAVAAFAGTLVPAEAGTALARLRATADADVCRWRKQSGYNGQMEKVGVAELKNRLSEYLQKVRAGETVLVFDRQDPVARIERVSPDSAPDDRARRLERAGIIRRGSGPVPFARLREPAPEARASVVQALVDERAEGR